MTATLIVWVLYPVFTDRSFSDIVNALKELSSAQMIFMIAAGVASIQVLQYYFRLFIPTKKGDEVNETAIAMWLASSPIFIFVSLIVLNKLGLNTGILAGLDKAEMTVGFAIAVVLTVGAMIRFETYGSSLENLFKRYGEVLKMLAMIVLYTVIISGILREDQMTTETALAIQPFFWIGFSAGMRTMAKKQNRLDFIENWELIKKYLLPITIVEVIGMGVFFFEFFALHGSDATLVNMIIGAHIIPVFIMIFLLSRLRKDMQDRGESSRKYFSIPLEVDTLPTNEISLGKSVWFTAVLVTMLLSIAIIQI